ncbi:hypothetical protein HNO92_003960 [Chromobacterium alkanivorans]|uniref:hypothetical protein n=1 Tax=Chromobacterium alkanivorans TaxID=1071719 RepID=UPI002167F23B|nr:hypothetical protein [Chromobacterium alkanivorans]MCS3817991.1 hypothetical protein [Chromobacterium alkanivorans]MCS3875611.1 hypothetical protein [Chromobacterium alkanivorans]
MLELAWIAGLSGEPSKKSRDAPQKVAAHLGSRAECGRGYHVAARFTENIRLFEVAFNALRQLEAYETIRNNTKQHPIAICGTIASIKPTSKNKAINLKKSKAIKHPDLPDNCVNIELSIFLKDSSQTDGLSEEDEIIAFGMWTRSPDQNGRFEKPIKYKTVTTRKLNLNPHLKRQIFKIQRR